MSIPEVVQTLASYFTTLLGLVANTVRCGACYILWFNTPIKKKKFSCPQTFLSCPCSKFCKLQGNYSITCISQGKRAFFPAWTERSINHPDWDASMVTKKSVSIYTEVRRHAFPSSAGTRDLHIPLSAY